LLRENAQKEGIDNNEIFSLIIKHTSIRMLLTVVAQFNLELEKMDVKTAFLHSELKEEIYMKQPESYIQEGQENKACLITKSLYGLKQSIRQRYKRFDSFMIKTRYNRCEYDSCVYFKRNDDPTYLLLYVDNMLIVARNKTHIQKLKTQLKKKLT